MNGITLHTAHNPHPPPDHVMQVAAMVRSLSNKYVPAPSLDEIEIDLQNSLKDFRYRCRKRATAIALRERSNLSPSRRPNDTDEWNETHQPEPIDDDRYGLGTNLYDTISAYKEDPSDHKRLEYFLNKLELEFAATIRGL
jgi:hypothetical protein